MSLYIFQNPLECTKPFIPNVNYELPVIMMCQCGFTLVPHADSRGDCMYGGRADMETVLPIHFGCEPNTVLKNEFYFLKGYTDTLGGF